MKINMNKPILNYFFLPFIMVFCVIFFSAYVESSPVEIKFPYKNAGLSEREAAAHLLNRFSREVKNVITKATGKKKSAHAK